MESSNLESEAVGPRFTLDGMTEARNQTMRALDVIASRVTPGITEEEGERLARKTLKELGLLLGWHKVVVRFGCNTVLEYGAPSKPGVILQADDIMTLDIGPLWNGWEGDGGNTYVVGNDPEMIRARDDVRALWLKVQGYWRDTGASGQHLYDYASNEADEMGWVLNPIMAGHRVADFPHAYQGRLIDLPNAPTTHRWILEILIRHKSRPIGAYYEDLLT